jgi:hypothetical protein
MAKDCLDMFIEGISQTMKAASKQAAPHFKGVIEASEALMTDLKTAQKAFQEKEKRVERKLKSGIRKTKGDPV